MRLAAMFAVAALAGGQTSSSSNSFNDLLATATSVVVADLVDGSAADDGRMVSVRATLRVARSLVGRHLPGEEISLSWRYKPEFMESPATAAAIPRERGLWILRREPPRAVEALAVGVGLGLRRFFLPAGDTPRYYDAAAPLSHKIACEIAPLIEEIAVHHSADLVVSNPMPVPKPGDPAVRNRVRFFELFMTLQSLDFAAVRDIYTEFSSRPEPSIKAIGIGGRLRNGDVSALPLLEANLAAVAPVFQSGLVTPFIAGMDLKGNLPAARSLARLAIGETALPGLETLAPMQLAWTGAAEFLPYYLVMLDSPDATTRGSALAALCIQARAPEHASACPASSPVRDAAIERAAIGHWKAWWEANRGQIAKTTPLPEVHAPARYSATPPLRPVEAPPEVRFDSLLRMARNSHDAVAGQLSGDDRASWLEVSAVVNAKLDSHEKRAQDALNAARIAGQLPDASLLRSLEADRNAILKDGLEALTRRLSAAGAGTLGKILGGMTIAGSAVR